MQFSRAHTFVTLLAVSTFALSGCSDKLDPTTPSDATAYAAFAPGNSEPKAWMSLPNHRSTHEQGASIAFEGRGTDQEDGALTGASLVWWSDRDGELGTGASMTRNNLSAGEHLISLTGTDSQGASYTHYRIITVRASANANQAPSAAISAPANNTSVAQGASVTFSGSASDAEDGSLSGSSLAWTSSLDGKIGTGASVTTSSLRAGTHKIELTAMDSRGTTGVASITLTVKVPSGSNEAPFGLISEPRNRSTFAQGTSIRFAGSATDPEDGQLTGASLAWNSDRDGQLGTGTSFTKNNLSVGEHLISLTSTDSQGATYRHYRVITVSASSTSVTNQSPSASISSPSNGASVAQGTSVTFAGSGSDPESGALSGSALVWTSSLSGQIGTGTSFSRSDLAAGTHTITLTVTDPQGATARTSRSLTITSSVPNSQPTARISKPAHKSSFAQGTSITFTGSGSDPEDGTLTGASLVWRSDRDGQLGTGTSFTRNNLSVGEHLISLTGTDSRGATNTHYRVITVTKESQQTISIGSVNVSLGSSTLQVGATTTASALVRDLLGSTLSGQVVSWSSSNTSVATVSSSGTVTAVGGGSASIRATVLGVTGSATVTVTVPATSGGTGSSGGSAEPAGMNTIYDSSPESSDWTKVGTATVRSESTAPSSGSGVVRITYPSGFKAGSAPGAFYPSRYFDGRTAYYGATFRVSSNFEGNPTNINKFIHFYICGLNRVFLMGYGNGLTPAFGLQQLGYAYNGGTATVLQPNQSSAQFVRGRWHRVEIVLVANTPGQKDGSIAMWLDGTKIMEYSGIGFCTSGSGKWEGINHSPTWGGAEGVVSSDFFVEWDHVRMSSK